jgi:ornithine cyclodeaminase
LLPQHAGRRRPPFDKEKIVLWLNASEVSSLLSGAEDSVLKLVRETYLMHTTRCAVAPEQAALRFPNQPQNRILAKPAYLPGRFQAAGLKWVASFPNNTRRGLERSSTIMLLNSVETGRPMAILESSQVNFERTAASAALAAAELLPCPCERAGFVGCGSVNWHTLRFLRKTIPSLRAACLYDSDRARAEQFALRAAGLGGLDITIARSCKELLAECPLVCFATSATTPYIHSPEPLRDVEVILNISLRDFAPEVILASDNVVDDPDHVCSSHTSLHLAEQKAGNRCFIRCTLGDILSGSATPKPDLQQTTIFSPFGLATLDLAVCHFLVERAQSAGAGLRIPAFEN